jgi:hypothetical protein
MAIIIPGNVTWKETNVEGNLKCPICTNDLRIAGFLGGAYCVNCNKYFKSSTE